MSADDAEREFLTSVAAWVSGAADDEVVAALEEAAESAAVVRDERQAMARIAAAVRETGDAAPADAVDDFFATLDADATGAEVADIGRHLRRRRGGLLLAVAAAAVAAILAVGVLVAGSQDDGPDDDTAGDARSEPFADSSPQEWLNRAGAFLLRERTVLFESTVSAVAFGPDGGSLSAEGSGAIAMHTDEADFEYELRVADPGLPTEVTSVHRFMRDSIVYGATDGGDAVVGDPQPESILDDLAIGPEILLAFEGLGPLTVDDLGWSDRFGTAGREVSVELPADVASFAFVDAPVTAQVFLDAAGQVARVLLTADGPDTGAAIPGARWSVTVDLSVRPSFELYTVDVPGQ